MSPPFECSIHNQNHFVVDPIVYPMHFHILALIYERHNRRRVVSRRRVQHVGRVSSAMSVYRGP